MNTFSDYSDFKDAPSSEKLTLAILNASKRLIAFSLHSGSIYKLLNFDVAVITSIEESGIALTEVTSLADVVAGSFYNDRENSTLYIQVADSGHPNSKFIHVTFQLFFSTGPVVLPHDLGTGFPVSWEPQIASTSDFSVEIDTVNQQNETIEGSGTLTLFNDSSFWPANFDKLFFENQSCSIYSWNRDLEASEARLLFRGKVESKAYNSKNISFKLKDLLSQLRNPVDLPEIQALGLRHSPEIATAKQRLIYGRRQGHRPTNVDAVIDQRYPLGGTISVTGSSATVTGSGTTFKTQVSPDDRLDILGIEYTVSSVASDTSLTLSENYAAASASGLAVDLLPERPKRWQNRVWNLAGHPLREPVTTIQVGSSASRLFVESTQDMFDGDYIYIGTLGSGELVTIDSVVNSTQLTLSTSLPINPATGTTVRRACVQNLKIDDTTLVYYRDYTVDATTAMLTLRATAETLAAPVRQALDSATFTNGSASVTGSSTNFKSFLQNGDVIRPFGTVDFYEILSVNSDTSITLRTNFTGSNLTAFVQYKNLIFDPEVNVLSCEVLGRTDDGTSSGVMLRLGPEMVKQLLLDAGFTAEQINSTSFTESQQLAPENLSFVIPKTYDETKTVTYREVINKINKSIFGILFQDNSFQMSYDILRPVIPASPIVIKESDCLNWSVTSTNANMIKKAIVNYGYKEHDPGLKESSFSIVTKESDIANYILGTSRERTFDSILTLESDAQRLCDRWKFLLEFSSNTVKISTKLQLINVEINDVIDFDHRKFYERFAGTSKRKFLAIEKISKSGVGVIIECVDLSNAFNRIALISDATTAWGDSTEDTKLQSGFISDDDGLIDNEENSFNTNLIW